MILARGINPLALRPRRSTGDQDRDDHSYETRQDQREEREEAADSSNRACWLWLLLHPPIGQNTRGRSQQHDQAHCETDCKPEGTEDLEIDTLGGEEIEWSGQRVGTDHSHEKATTDTGDQQPGHESGGECRRQASSRFGNPGWGGLA